MASLDTKTHLPWGLCWPCNLVHLCGRLLSCPGWPFVLPVLCSSLSKQKCKKKKNIEQKAELSCFLLFLLMIIWIYWGWMKAPFRARWAMMSGCSSVTLTSSRRGFPLPLLPFNSSLSPSMLPSFQPDVVPALGPYEAALMWLEVPETLCSWSSLALLGESIRSLQ